MIVSRVRNKNRIVLKIAKPFFKLEFLINDSKAQSVFGPLMLYEAQDQEARVPVIL